MLIDRRRVMVVRSEDGRVGVSGQKPLQVSEPSRRLRGAQLPTPLRAMNPLPSRHSYSAGVLCGHCCVTVLSRNVEAARQVELEVGSGGRCGVLDDSSVSLMVGREAAPIRIVG